MSKSRENFYAEIELAATKAAPLFQQFGWTYGEGTVPTSSEIEETIGRLVDSVLEWSERPEWDGHSTCASGRFFVSYRKYDEEKELSIKLELAEHTEFKD